MDVIICSSPKILYTITIMAAHGDFLSAGIPHHNILVVASFGFPIHILLFIMWAITPVYQSVRYVVE